MSTSSPTLSSPAPSAPSAPPSPPMRVPLLDLTTQYASLKAEVLPVIERVLDGQQLVGGPEVTKLEAAVAAVSGCDHAVGVSSGTDALLAALMGLGVGPGEEVITTPFTFFATAAAIWRVGARPVFVDIDEATYNLDPTLIDAAVTDRTRAIMPVHLYGQMAQMTPILDLAKRRGLRVIEDAAQSIGATQRGHPAGSLGDCGCLSFFPTKNLGGAGDGGMVTTNHAQLAASLRQLRNHGMEPKYYYPHIGGNFRLDTIQAAYLLVKLPHLDTWSARRRANAAIYDEMLGDVEGISTPVILKDNVSIYNQYVIRTPRRDALRAHLAANGVGSEVYYPLCLHEQACFRELGYGRGDFPLAERAADEVVALPIYPELEEEQVRYVATCIRDFAGA